MSTANRPILSRLPSRKSTKSLRSLRSGYSRMFLNKKGVSPSMAGAGARKRSISVSALASPVITGSMIIHNDYVDETGNNNSVKGNKYERRLSKTR